MRSSPCASSFNEAEAVEPRKPEGTERMRRGSRSGFNEAEAVEPRKPEEIGAAIRVAPYASMRPRLLSLGNRPSTCSTRPRTWRFNEAEAVEPRKLLAQHVELPLAPASMRPRLLSLGNAYGQVVCVSMAVASMRPRLLSLGNRPGTINRSLGAVKLQ